MPEHAVFWRNVDLRLWTRKTVECYKWELLSSTSRSLEENNAESNMVCGHRSSSFRGKQHEQLS